MDIFNIEEQRDNPDLDEDLRELLRIKDETVTVVEHVIFEDRNPELLYAANLSQTIEDVKESAKTDNVDAMKECIGIVVDQGGGFMIDKDSNKSVLHLALEHESWNVAKYLIKTLDRSVLDNDYTVWIDYKSRKLETQKTCLHLLAEAGKLSLIKLLLLKIEQSSNSLELTKFCNQTTLTNVPQTEPDELAAVHLAALNGHLKVLQYFSKKDSISDIKTKNGETLGLLASRNNHLDVIKELNSIDSEHLKYSNNCYEAPIHIAVRNNYIELTECLVNECHVDVNAVRKKGLKVPLITAAALRRTDLLSLLIKKGAKIDVTGRHNLTALHYASVLGYCDVVYALIEAGANKEATDDSGNTPLLSAVQAGKLQTVKLLIDEGASISCINANKETVWELALEQSDSSLLKYLTQVGLKKKEAGMQTILHSAARIGNEEKVKCLLDLNVKANQLDTERNLPLHVAAGSKNVTGSLISLLIKNMTLGSQNDANAEDKTALHVAVETENFTILPYLSTLDPWKKNGYGDGAWHSAIRTDNQEVIENMINVFGNIGNNIDNVLSNGDETLLHIAAKRGNTKTVKYLIACKADLSKKNELGNTPLHEIVGHSLEPSKTEGLLEVLQVIGECAIFWWCNKQIRRHPIIESKAYKKLKAEAMIYLTSRIENDAGKDVIEMAASIGAVDMLTAILNIDGVYKFKGSLDTKYDITDIMPNLKPDKDDEKKQEDDEDPVLAEDIPMTTLSMEYRNTLNGDYAKPLPKPKKNQIGVDATTVAPVQRTPSAILEESYLDERGGLPILNHIMSYDDPEKIDEMLKITPINEIVIDNYLTSLLFFYPLLVLHIIHMSCFTHYGMTVLTDTSDSEHFAYIGFSIWPLSIWIFYLVKYGIKLKKHACPNAATVIFELLKLLFCPIHTLKLIINHSTTFTALVFPGLTIAWLVLVLVRDVNNQVYFTALILIIGWMFTLALLPKENILSFTSALRLVLIQDILRYMFVYVLIMLSFSFGIQALVLVIPDLNEAYSSSWQTVFTIFNLMIGMGDGIVFDEGFNESYESAGKDPTFLKIIYTTYICLTTIIFLNFIVAMMTDSYSDIKKRKSTLWRVEVVKWAIEIDELPLMSRMKNSLSSFLMKRFEVKLLEDGRFYIMIPNVFLKEKELTSNTDHEELMQTINELKEELSELTKKVEKITLQQDTVDSASSTIADRFREMRKTNFARTAINLMKRNIKTKK